MQVIGNGNYYGVLSKGSHVIGNHNTIGGGEGFIVTGNHNTITGVGVRVTGNHNVIRGDFCTATGNHNSLTGYGNNGIGSYVKLTNARIATIATPTQVAEYGRPKSMVIRRVDTNGRTSVSTNIAHHPSSLTYVDGDLVFDGGQISIGSSYTFGVGGISRDLTAHRARSIPDRLRQPEPSAPPPPPPPPPLSPPIKYPAVPDKEELVPDGTPEAEVCIFCVERRRSVIALPCGHRYECATCASKGVEKQCAICREPLTELKRIYDA